MQQTLIQTWNIVGQVRQGGPSLWLCAPPSFPPPSLLVSLYLLQRPGAHVPPPMGCVVLRPMLTRPSTATTGWTSSATASTTPTRYVFPLEGLP